jgi:hypothetical protein
MVPELLQQIAVQPVSGRLLARQLPEATEVLVGVVHLPADFVPKEGALYLAIYAEGRFYVTPSTIDDGLPDEIQGFGMENALRANCWRKTNAVGTLTVRFMEAFPEQNGWTLYGASNQPIFPPSRYERGHAFFELDNGALNLLPAEENVHGHTMSQLLDSRAIWPDANGVMHSVPTHESAWRPVYHEYAVLRARVGAGEITREELHAAVAANERLSKIREYGNPDMAFYDFLAARHAAGDLQPERPMRAEEIEQRERGARRAILSSIDM